MNKKNKAQDKKLVSDKEIAQNKELVSDKGIAPNKELVSDKEIVPNKELVTDKEIASDKEIVPPKALISNKGLSYEYKILSLFQKQGYLARRGIPLLNEIYEDATDIDVLGIKFIHPFKELKVICDCKNKKSPHPYERIFWTKGLGEFLGVKEVFVALPKASEESIKFATKGNVKILTEEIINNYMECENKLMGVADEQFYKNKTIFHHKSRDSKEINKFYINVKVLYNYENIYTAFNKALNMLDEANKKIYLIDTIEDKQEIKFSWKYITYELIVIVSVLLLRMCCDTLTLSKDSREKHIKSKLTYGDIEPNKANGLIKSILNLSNEMLKHTMEINNIKEFELLNLDQIDSPKYAVGIINLIEMMLSNPNYYIDLPQVINYMLFECALKERDFSYEEFEKIFGTSFTKEKIKASKNVFAILQTYCKIIIKDIWKKQE
ncbi:hypothetical protein [Clostridium estertheticum]|uniref:hypothetical protein n=1 Tax=Clostridium estertheticum TaxID=238834 RepID=UPI001C0AEFD0|nr:hypothetical protein [Clostridium estertheticum]MBU3187671.1 hypothetical protein [Clostridium estertheticum]